MNTMRAAAHVIQPLRQTIVQHGAMSGDQFQIAVAMMLDPELKLILIGERGPNPQDKSESIYNFYTKQSGIDPSRIYFNAAWARWRRGSRPS
jgi:hypothetical protein